MLANHHQPPRLDLSKGWPCCVKSAVLHAIALAHYISTNFTPSAFLLVVYFDEIDNKY